jgi:thioredoxin 1
MKKVYLPVFLLVFLLAATHSCGKGEASEAGKVLMPVSVEVMLKDAGKFKLTVIELGSVNCRPCQMMTPVLEAVARDYKDRVRVVFFDVWQDQTPARHYAIRVIPVQVIIDGSGKEVYRHEGYIPETELKSVIDGLLKN